MPPAKYTDFQVSEPFTIRSKRNKDEEIMREYVKITCPHCQHQIGDIPVDILKVHKAGKCKAHLEVCPEFKAKGGDVAPAPVRASTADLMKQMADMRREMQQNHRESMARLSQAFGLGDPDAQTENELVVRGKRKFEEANVFGTIAKDDDGIQFFRKMFHPDKKATRSPKVNAICDLLMEQLLEAQKHKK